MVHMIDLLYGDWTGMFIISEQDSTIDRAGASCLEDPGSSPASTMLQTAECFETALLKIVM